MNENRSGDRGGFESFHRLARDAEAAARRRAKAAAGHVPERASRLEPAAHPGRVRLRVGLVLAGGGAKGAYELGVCDYLAEIGADIAAIAGTSIGALNGAVLAAEPDLMRGAQRLADFWERFATQSGVKPFADHELPVDGIGLPQEDGGRQLRSLAPRLLRLRRRAAELEQLVNDAVDPAAIRAGRPLWVGVYPLGSPALSAGARPRRRYEVLRWMAGAKSDILLLNELPEEEIRQAVLASAALPFIFPVRTVSGRLYLDGGLGGRKYLTPVHAFAQQEDCEVLLVVHLDPQAIVDAGPAERWVRIDLRPSVPIVPPGPLGSLTAMLAFAPDRVQRLRALGYRDARTRFTEIHRRLESSALLAVSEERMLAALWRLHHPPGPRGAGAPRPPKHD